MQDLPEGFMRSASRTTRHYLLSETPFAYLSDTSLAFPSSNLLILQLYDNFLLIVVLNSLDFFFAGAPILWFYGWDDALHMTAAESLIPLAMEANESQLSLHVNQSLTVSASDSELSSHNGATLTPLSTGPSRSQPSLLSSASLTPANAGPNESQPSSLSGTATYVDISLLDYIMDVRLLILLAA